MKASKLLIKRVRQAGPWVFVSVLALLFLFAGCQWAPNQSGSEMTIQIDHGATATQSSTADPGTETTSMTQALDLPTVISSMEAVAESEIGALQEELETFDDSDFEFFDLDFDRESGLMLYYIEEEYLISQGEVSINAQGLLDEFFEENYEQDLFNAFEQDFEDPEYFEQIETQLISLVEEYEKNVTEFVNQYGEPDAETGTYEDEEVQEAYNELNYSFFLAFFELLFEPLVAVFDFINDLYLSGITLQERFPVAAGGFAANIRGGTSYQGAGSSTSFTFRDLQPGATYVVIAAYFETEFSDDVETPDTNYEMLGIGRVTLEEGTVQSLRLPLTTLAETEAQLNEWYPGVNFNFDSAFDLFGDFETAE